MRLARVDVLPGAPFGALVALRFALKRLSGTGKRGLLQYREYG